MTILGALGVLFIAFAYSPIRSRLSMAAYERWIRTFNDPGIILDAANASQTGTSNNTSGWLSVDGITPRGLGRFILRRWQGGIRSEENTLPGDIFWSNFRKLIKVFILCT